jgi:hypothetical protein
MKRITDSDLEFRHSPFCAMLAVLGYVDQSMSNAAIMDVYRRISAVEARGDIAIPENGHYHLARTAYERCVKANEAQPRARR